jgi:hypothetical protein
MQHDREKWCWMSLCILSSLNRTHRKQLTLWFDVIVLSHPHPFKSFLSLWTDLPKPGQTLQKGQSKSWVKADSTTDRVWKYRQVSTQFIHWVDNSLVRVADANSSTTLFESDCVEVILRACSIVACIHARMGVYWSTMDNRNKMHPVSCHCGFYAMIRCLPILKYA